MTTVAGAASSNLPERYTQGQLDQFMAAHERFIRRQPHGRRMNLMYLQAQDMSFAGRLLTEVDLTGANLQRARLIGADLERANLFCADMTGADARNANFRRADVRGVSLRNADLSGCILDDADLREAMLARVSAHGYVLTGRSATAVREEGQTLVFAVDFSNCSMNRAKLTNAKLKGANFTGALLQGVNLQGANLTGCQFDGAVLTGADLTGATYAQDALAKCVMEPSAQALKRVAELVTRLDIARRWVESNGREGSAAILDDEDLRPLARAFYGRPLTALSAKRVRAIGVSFQGVQLQGANFEGADLREADFSDADLRGASFRGANLRHARFDRADVRPLPLPDGRVREVCLDGANAPLDCFARSIAA